MCACGGPDDGWMEGSLLGNFIFVQCTEGHAKEDALVSRVVSDDLRPAHHLNTVHQNVQFPQIPLRHSVSPTVLHRLSPTSTPSHIVLPSTTIGSRSQVSLSP